jgi:hypothetical protein
MFSDKKWYSAFRYLCSARGEKIERDSFFYASLARAVREGGFFVAVVARLSVIPGHCERDTYLTQLKKARAKL